MTSQDVLPTDRLEQVAVWTATEALTWLGCGKALTWSELVGFDQRFIERWKVAPPADAMQRLLDALGAPESFVLWHPVMSRDEIEEIARDTECTLPSQLAEGSDDSVTYGARKLEEVLLREHQARLGHALNYAELAELLRAEREKWQDRADRWNSAHKRLRDALLSEQVTAWGVRASDPKMEHVPLPPQVALRAIQFRADCIEPDQCASMDDFTAIMSGERWVQLRLQATEVMKLGSAVSSIFGGEKAVQSFLEAGMRASPIVSPGKSVMQKQAKAMGHSFSTAGFHRAWAAAVKATGADAWSKSGRKSKGPID